MIHITGRGVVSSLGLNLNETYKNILENKSNARVDENWAILSGLKSHVVARVPDYEVKDLIPRQLRRTMSPQSEFTILAVSEALLEAGLTAEDLNKKRVLILAGSTTGSPITFDEIHKKLHATNSTSGQLSTSVFKCMSHTIAANLSGFLNFEGAVISIASACATSAQAIIMAREYLANGLYDLVIAGGADEAHITSCVSFDVAMAASSQFNQAPQKASRPFDRNRDGLVVSEGAGFVILETETSMLNRGAKSFGKILSGSSIVNGTHMGNPNGLAIQKTIKTALNLASIHSDEIDYVNAHATSTILGDIEEANAIYNVLENNVMISSFKGHLGHSFAACGAIEVALISKMSEEGKVLATLNLEEIDPSMPKLQFVQKHQSKKIKNILTTNFAFGGVNTAILMQTN
jgi:3-oxoacyl-[acyl-carrier-protein] synthase II